MTVMSMPEAPMNEDYGAVFGEDKVWLTRQALVVKTVAKA